MKIDTLLYGKFTVGFEIRGNSRRPIINTPRRPHLAPRLPIGPRVMEYVLTPVVLDNGSGMIKAGYAGEEIPKSFFPS